MVYGKRPPLDEQKSLWEASLAVEGVTTGAGAVTGDSFIDAALIGAGANSFVSMLAVVYPGQPQLVDSMDITAFNNATGEVTLSTAYKGVAAAIPAGVPYKIVTFRFVPAEVAALTALVTGKLNVQDVVIYPVAEDADTDEIADDGTSPPYYPAAAHSTDSNAEATPGVAWTEDIDFEQEGVVNLISIYAEFEWQTKVTVGGGDATNSISKIQISRDGGANWVDITDNFTNPAVAMTNRKRFGVGLWVTTIVAGVDQLQFRLCHWTDDSVGGVGRSSSEAQIRCNSYARLTYRKS